MPVDPNRFDPYTARLIANEIIAKRRYPFDENSVYDREQQCAQHILQLAQLVEDARAQPKWDTTVDYRCQCGAKGVKLWRHIHGAPDTLYCRLCAMSSQVEQIAAYADLPTSSDTIGDLLPAVPVDDTFWGYSSVPQYAVDWWKALKD